MRVSITAIEVQLPGVAMRRCFLAVLLLALPQIVGCASSAPCFTAPTITGQPANQTVSSGDPAIFTVSAIGSGAMSYQWLKGGQPVAGATQSSYVTPATTAGDSGSAISVTVSNNLGAVTSSPASLTVVAPAAGDVRFVATTGSDSNPGTIDLPYQTIQHCASSMEAGGTCAIRAGTYRETVTPNSNITITAYHFEPVVVDGSDPVTGWTLDHGTVYKTNVALRQDDTNQIFVGSEMMTEARWPNGDDLFNINWATAKKGSDQGHIVDSSLPAVDWTGAKVRLWSGTDPFSNQTGSIVSSSKGQIGIDVGQSSTCPTICPAAGGYYYLFGTLAALDAEREWFYDTASSTLYFMPPAGMNPNSLDVRSKQRMYAFDLRGKTGVTVSNLSIFASTIILDNLSQGNTLDRLNAQYVSHFTLLPPLGSSPGTSDFTFIVTHRNDTGFVIYGTANTVENSTILYSAGDGIAVEGIGNTVRNNLIRYVDYAGDYASGVVLDFGGNTIQSNTIRDVGRQAIDVDSFENQDISFNNLFGGMQLSTDGAEIYACCNAPAVGTRIHHNWLHDTVPVVSEVHSDHAMSGVSIDNGSSGFVIDQNVIWNNQTYNLVINGQSGTQSNNNSVLNNSIPDSSYDGRINILNVSNCSATRVANNQVVVGVEPFDSGPCNVSNNGKDAPGANEMTPSTQVGCNFAGCSSFRPPTITAGGNVVACSANE